MTNAGLQETFRLLAETQNETAPGVLIAALDCPYRPTRHHALRALLERRDAAGHREIFRRLPTLDEASRAVINERPEGLVRVVSDAVKKASRNQCATACDALVSFRLYNALPALVAVLTDTEDPPAELLARTALKLTEEFYAELSGVDEAPKRKNQDVIRDHVTESLEDAARRFHRHRRTEIIEAFLLVAKPKNITLRRLLQRDNESAHQPILQLLCGSRQGGVVRLLLGMLEDPQMPRAIVNVIASRSDEKFVKNFLRAMSRKPSPAVAQSLARFDSFPWARAGNPLLEKLDDRAQQGAVHVLMASNMDRQELLQVIGFLLQRGKAGARRAAAAALAEFQGPEADALTVRALHDTDPQVRAALIPQLRLRRIPGALSLLIRMVDIPDERVHQALRNAMPEFTFQQFMTNFDSMPESLQPLAGHLVRKIDSEAPDQLAALIDGLSPVRRRRAVQAAGAMGLARLLEPAIIERLSDEDHLVRAAAAKVLADCRSMPTWEALRDALLDRSVIVQEAAEQSLQQISRTLMEHFGEDTQTEGNGAKEGEKQEGQEKPLLEANA